MLHLKFDRFLAGILLLTLLLGTLPTFADDEDLKTCYYKFSCTYPNGHVVTIRMPGTGPSETEAYAQALVYANQARDQCLSMSGTASTPVQDGCDGPPGPGPGPGPGPMPPGVKVAMAYSASPMIVLEHTCYTQAGTQISQLSYGPRQMLDALSDTVWNSLAVEAAAQGGIAPGTGRTRVEDMFYYYVYQTVRSTHAANKTHREYTVEGKGTTDAEARQSAAQATKKLIAQMSARGEIAQAVGPPRPAPVVKVHHSSSTLLCVHQCVTATGWTVIATDYALTKASACSRASAVAHHLANTNYGGALACQEIPPHGQP